LTADNRVDIISPMSQTRRHPNVVNRDEVQPMPVNKGKHQMVLWRLGAPAGRQLLGANLTEVAPGPEHPHQMINDGAEPLIHLCVSASVQKVDVVGYPDSKKVAATAGAFDKPIHRWISREGESVDCWDGEPDAQ
jgi:hypothetical protein